MPDNENENQDPNESNDLRQVRDALKREKKAREAAEATAAESANDKRENVMLRAGIDLDTPLGQLFADGYKGELDKEAIKAAWGVLGVTPSNETPTADPNANDDGSSAEEIARQQREAALSNGGTQPGTEPTPDPYIDALQRYHDSGGNQQTEAQVAGIQAIFDAAAKGDARVAVPGPLDRDTRNDWDDQHRARMRKVRDMGRGGQ